jgi:acid stress chaperone HdeB
MENAMMKLVFVASGLMVALNTAPNARAQVALDMSKVTCDQFRKYKIASPQYIAIWLNGYYSGKRGNTIVETQDLVANAKKVQDYCFKNPETPVMQAVETLSGPGK